MIEYAKKKDKPIPEPAPDPTPEPKKSKIIIWAEAIKIEEGWFRGSRSQRNNNPGNLKYSNLTASLGAYLKDKDNFAIFRSEEAGFNALCSFLVMACENRLKPYKNVSLKQFSQIYANPPSDKYARNVAKALNVSVDTPIKEFL